MPPTLFITIDTEEDLWGEFRPADNPVANIAELPILQAVFRRFGAVPTYLVNYAVVDDPSAAATLRGMRDSDLLEIGAHCHPWNTPPFEEQLSGHNSMLCNLPEDLIARKLDNLHARIVDTLGATPSSFRAGRWGFNESVARSIARLGYSVDSSICPTMDWSSSDGPDYTDATIEMYRFDPSAIRVPSPKGSLLEVPATVGFWQGFEASRSRFRKRIGRGITGKLHMPGVLDRLRLLNHRWLSPEQSTTKDMIGLAEAAIRGGQIALNMCFHSNSMVPGITPFVRTDADRREFIARIETFLDYATRKGFKFAALSDAAAIPVAK